MKAVIARAIVIATGIILAVPFAAAALLVGARAAAGAESAEHRLTLIALAVGVALISGTKGLSRTTDAAREGHALHVTPARAGGHRHAFMRTHGW